MSPACLDARSAGAGAALIPAVASGLARGDGHAGRWPGDARAAKSPPRSPPKTTGNSTTPTTSEARCSCCGWRDGRRSGPSSASRSSPSCAPKATRTAAPWTRACRLPLYVRVRPWTDRPVRHPGRPDSAGVRRRRPSHLRERQRAHRLPAGVAVLDGAAPRRGAGQRRRADLRAQLGWQPGYSVGDDGYARGVPLATAFRYDTGVEARVGDEREPRLGGGGAVTAGTLSSPGARSSNGGPQVSTRVAVRPIDRAGHRRVVRRRAVRRRHACRERDCPPIARAVGAVPRSRRSGRRRRVLARALAGARRAGGRAMDAARPRRPAHRQAALGPRASRSRAAIALAPGVTAAARVDHLGFSELARQLP